MKGRKRFAAGDTQGNLLESMVLPANSGERAGAWLLLQKLKTSVLGQNIKLIRADEGFGGVDWERQVQEHFGWPVEIVRKPPGQVGFALLPRRWVIEQTFGCWGRNRRLSRDYEQNPIVAALPCKSLLSIAPYAALNPLLTMIRLSAIEIREDRL